MGGMKPINVEMLLSHSIGISNSYYKPTEIELLEDYLRVCDSLLIDREEEKTLKELKINEQRNNEEVYMIKGKLLEKDDQIKQLNEKYEKEMKNLQMAMEDKFNELIQRIDTNKI